jgi:lipopolysaccharide export system protein LptA
MRHPDIKTLLATVFILTVTGPLLALESDRQQPLLVNADTTDGTLGDGIAIMSGQVEIRQGSLLVRADVAEVEKIDGRVRQVKLTGTPVHLQQEIENEGLVTATAGTISYKVATGMVTLTGKADVDHPQYQISGEELIYDMNLQHFQGNGGDGNGRIRIELAPEVVPEIDSEIDRKPDNPEAESDASSLPQGASVAQDGSRTDHAES